MTYHLLNGDALAETFRRSGIEGEVLICRECLVDGPVQADNEMDFFRNRSLFLTGVPDDERYFKEVIPAFHILSSLPSGSEICLWFEDDLFCQVNLWFALSKIHASAGPAEVWRIFPQIPESKGPWGGFAWSDEEMLRTALQQRQRFTAAEILLGNQLWQAYKKNDRETLRTLSDIPVAAFRQLPEVIGAHLERFPDDGSEGRPERILRVASESYPGDFGEIFRQFSEVAGIYGFGDTQVKSILERISKQAG